MFGVELFSSCSGARGTGVCVVCVCVRVCVERRWVDVFFSHRGLRARGTQVILSQAPSHPLRLPVCLFSGCWQYAGVDRSPLDSSPEVQEIHRRLSSFLTRCLRKYGERVSSVPLGMSAQSYTNVGRSKQETKTGAGGGAASHVVYEIMLAVHAIEPLDSAWQIFVVRR